MNRIITVSREFGSGGRELGKRLADVLGFAYYDREIITAISEKSGLAEKYVESMSEKGSPFYYPITIQQTISYQGVVYSAQTEIMAAQQKMILEVAQKSDCVIVGRCADLILKDFQPLNLFVYADMDSKVARCLARKSPGENFTDSELRRQIRRIDRDRAKYRSLYYGAKWGDKADYHLCVNTTGLPIKKLIPVVTAYADCYFNREK